MNAGSHYRNALVFITLSLQSFHKECPLSENIQSAWLACVRDILCTGCRLCARPTSTGRCWSRLRTRSLRWTRPRPRSQVSPRISVALSFRIWFGRFLVQVFQCCNRSRASTMLTTRITIKYSVVSTSFMLTGMNCLSFSGESFLACGGLLQH